MELKVDLNSVYLPVRDLIAKDIQGELIIIPIASGLGDLESEIFRLNETGRAIWDKFDGKRTLKEIAKDLSLDFKGCPEDIEKDITEITEELLKRRMLIEVNNKL